MPAFRLLAAAAFALLLLRPAIAEEAAVVSEQRLLNSVKYLASDELEGRGPGTKGIDLAADYIASEFQKLGLKTELFDGGPFQKFDFHIDTEIGPKERNVLSFIQSGDAGTKPLELNVDFTPLACGNSLPVDAPLAFVGYGISAKEKDWSYDEYEGIDVKGKVVIVVRKEPQQDDEKSVFDGKKNSRHALFNTKLVTASQHGAAAVIFVNEGKELTGAKESIEKQLAEALEDLAKVRAESAKQESPTDEETDKFLASIGESSEMITRLAKEARESQDKLLHFKGSGQDGASRKMPVFFCTRGTIDKLLAAASKETLDSIEAKIDADLKPQSFVLTDWKAAGEANLNFKRADLKNVVAVLEGEGPLADETIVIGAHYDHVGYGGLESGSLAPWTREIHNGADDNASGTAALLELAYRFATSKEKPARRIVFIAFSGEERGLLGSAFYVKNPRFSLEKTVAMFNFDMVGRLKDNKLIVYGTGTAPEFDPLIDSLGKELQFKVTKHAEGLGPSDHQSFYLKKIPVLHFFTGTHSEYHRPNDDTPLIQVAGMRRVVDFSEAVVRKTAAAPERPKYVEIKNVSHGALDSSGDPGASNRPYFGSLPDYANEEPGVLLSGVQPGSPADKAGIKSGDLIVKFGGTPVTNIEDYMGAMMKYKPGDKVKVGVKRGKEELELEATLTKRPIAPMEQPKTPPKEPEEKKEEKKP